MSESVFVHKSQISWNWIRIGIVTFNQWQNCQSAHIVIPLFFFVFLFIWHFKSLHSGTHHWFQWRNQKWRKAKYQVRRNFSVLSFVYKLWFDCSVQKWNVLFVCVCVFRIIMCAHVWMQQWNFEPTKYYATLSFSILQQIANTSITITQNQNITIRSKQ